MAPDENDRPCASQSAVAGDGRGDAVGGQRRRRGGCDAPSLQPGSVAANPCGSATSGTVAEERTPTQLFSAWAALYHGKVGTGTCLAPWALSPRTLA